MTPEEQARFDYTLKHFKEIARQNRFPENDKIEHDRGRCVVCDPDRVPMHPFALAVEIMTECIQVRRPKLDRELVALLNDDRRLMGLEGDLTLERIFAGDEEAVSAWRDWVHEALDTALSLLSLHADKAPDYSLDDAEELGMEEFVEEKVDDIMAHQRANVE